MAEDGGLDDVDSQRSTKVRHRLVTEEISPRYDNDMRARRGLFTVLSLQSPRVHVACPFLLSLRVK